jgi:hypothetical protein
VDEPVSGQPWTPDPAFIKVRCPHCWAPAGTPCAGQTLEQAERGDGFHEGRGRAAGRVALARAGLAGSPASGAQRPQDGTDEAGLPWFPDDGTPQPLVQYSVHVFEETEVGRRRAGYVRVTVDAGPRPPEHVVPPAGEAHAFDAARWARRIEVSVSPTGRSARVWVDGVEIPAPK